MKWIMLAFGSYSGWPALTVSSALCACAFSKNSISCICKDSPNWILGSGLCPSVACYRSGGGRVISGAQSSVVAFRDYLGRERGGVFPAPRLSCALTSLSFVLRYCRTQSLFPICATPMPTRLTSISSCL